MRWRWLAVLAVLSGVVAAESPEVVITREIPLAEGARTWGLSEAEFRRYQGLMAGRRGQWSPGLDPITALGVSKDSAKKHQNFIAKHDLTVDLATDAADGGLSDELGVWTEKQMYGKTYMGMVRSTFLIGADGRILRVWPKVKVKGHAEEVLEAATKA